MPKSTSDIATQSPFETIKRTDESGNEYWVGHELQPLMAYRCNEEFEQVVVRAKRAAAHSGHDVGQEFSASSGDLPGRGSPLEGYRLTRLAAHLVAMNGDPSRPEVSAAQVYFALHAQEAERSSRQDIEDGLDALQVVIDRLRENHRRIASLETVQQDIKSRLAVLEGHQDWLTALGYAKHEGLPTDRSYLIKVGARAAATMRARGESPLPQRDARYGSVNSYPVEVLDQAFRDIAR